MARPLALEFLVALSVSAQMAWFQSADMLYRFETQHPLAAGALYSGLETGLAYLFLDDNPTFGGFVLSFVAGVMFFGAMGDEYSLQCLYGIVAQADGHQRDEPASSAGPHGLGEREGAFREAPWMDLRPHQ